MATPVAAANKMNSSPTVSKPRYSKFTADTTPVALVWATAIAVDDVPVRARVVAEAGQAGQAPQVEGGKPGHTGQEDEAALQPGSFLPPPDLRQGQHQQQRENHGADRQLGQA